MNKLTWTDERTLQLNELETMLHSLSLLDNGNNFIANLQKCISTAKSLREWKSDDHDFIYFLKEICIKDRRLNKEVK